MPKLDVVLGRSSVLKSDRLANHKRHSFGLGFADLLGGQSAAVASVQHFVSLCCRQHKLTYVAQRIMWRSPRHARRCAPFGTAKRHITWRVAERESERVRTPDGPGSTSGGSRSSRLESTSKRRLFHPVVPIAQSH